MEYGLVHLVRQEVEVAHPLLVLLLFRLMLVLVAMGQHPQ
jgi:hypothetical protein